MKMADEHTLKDDQSAFKSGAREARQAQAAWRPAAARRAPANRLEIAIHTEKPSRDSRGNDPYNTSGSFDRSRNWARVGKR